MYRVPVSVKKSGGFFSAAKKAKICFKTERDYGYLLGLCGIDLYDVEPNNEKIFALVVGDGAVTAPLYKDEEAYRIEITEAAISITANTEKGLSQGVKQLALIYIESNGKYPCMVVEDRPEISFRCTHMCIFNPLDGTEKDSTEPEDIKYRLKVLALTGYNYFFLEFWGMFPYKKRPYACWPHSNYDRKTVEDIISYAIDMLHITPLPAQNLTSHAGWSRIISRKHVVLDQRPDLADMWIPGGWCFATENPDTREYLKDIMDDLIETFRNPPLLHASCDKCFGFGSTEEDRTKPADTLFVNHLCNLNSYLQSKGVRMTMWGDMIYSSMDSLYWKADSRTADILPKNILINIWTHNDIGTQWADVDFFQSRGFETVYSPFINRRGAESMVKLCKQKHSLGIVQTTWHRPAGTMPTVVYTASLSWSGAVPTDGEISELLEKIK